MTTVRPLHLPVPSQYPPETGPLILRDGTTATIKTAGPDDREDIKKFFNELSPDSKRRRFFSTSPSLDKILDWMTDPSEPSKKLTLIVARVWEGRARIIAAGSYFGMAKDKAEVAIAVHDDFQGKGLGTLILERLALLAVRHGITRFYALAQADNAAILDVLRSSGFPTHEKAGDSYVELDFSLVPTQETVARSEMRDRIATTASLIPFFRPRSVAVVGASRDPSSIGYRLLNAILASNFQGPVYPVNPKATVIRSMRAVPSVRELPEAVDLAVIAVPRDAVLGVVDECAAIGTRALVVVTAGFAEVDEEGRVLQQKLVEKVRGYGMRMIGPNCMGLLNTDPSISLNATFTTIFPPNGRIALASQSGALGLVILSHAQQIHLGLSSFVSVGNKADVSGNDLLQYWEQDPGTNVILLYLESFGNPRRFSRIARRITRQKPIVVVRGGRTLAGKRAAGSHTAALAANETAVDALFQQTGVIRAETLEEMFDVASALARQPLPRGRRVGIVTNAGGPGILCADACEASGLVISEFSDKTKRILSEFLPRTASVKNPVDMIASASPADYQQAVESLLRAEEIDAVIVVFLPIDQSVAPQTIEAIMAGISSARDASIREKPVLACVMGGGALGVLSSEKETIPAYLFPEDAARVLGKVAKYAEWRSQPAGDILSFGDTDPEYARQICRRTAETGGGWLSAEDARAVLAAFGLPIASGGVARTADEAVKLAEKLGYPVAVKLASRRIIHKSEAGGVMLDLHDESSVSDAFETIRKRVAESQHPDAMDGVLVQPMLTEGVEVMAGVTDDANFGHLIGFGLGGIHVEILGDVKFRVAPLTDRDAKEMVMEIRGYRLLEGYRGHSPADVDALAQVLLRLSLLVEEVEQIRELDLNPIFALPPGKGCVIIDARIRVGPPPRPS